MHDTIEPGIRPFALVSTRPWIVPNAKREIKANGKRKEPIESKAPPISREASGAARDE